MKINLTLPMPPSMNQAFPTGKQGRRYKSPEYKTWIEHARIALGGQDVRYFEKDVSYHYDIYFRNGQSGDCENRLKILTDFLVSQGILRDDKHTILKKGSFAFAGYDPINPHIDITVEGT